jgi:hypothetical protein
MSHDRVVELRALEGREVTLALADGRRIDGASLLSAARHGADTVCVYVTGAEHFLPIADIVDVYAR